MPPPHKSMPPLHNGHRESSEELLMVRLDTDGNVLPYDPGKLAWERPGRNVVAARRAQGPTRAGPDPGGPRRPGRIGAGLRGQDRARSAGHADDSTMTDKRTLEQHGRAMMRIFGFELQTVGVTG